MRLLVPLTLVGCIGSGTAVPIDARSELTSHVDAIRKAELALQAVDDFLPCEDEAAANRKSSAVARDWDGADCWVRIGWAPEGRVHGGYWVEVAADGSDFTVHGVVDGDGDGTFLHVQGSRTEAAHVTSPPEVM